MVSTFDKKFKGHTDHTKLAAKPGDKIKQYINKKALELKLLKGNMQFQLKQLIKNKN